jgi:hypothetical protein
MAGDAMGAGAPGMPSEAELEQMLVRMREAPVEQVLVEVVNVLLQAAQVKLGRPDARVLIDAVAAVAEVASGRIDPALVGQVGQAVAQLRLAQVEAEGGAEGGAQTGDGGARPAGAAGGAPGGAAGRAAEPAGHAGPAPQPPRAAPSAGAAAPPDAGAAQRSRLWVPGR